ncbi:MULTISPECIES: hypothetical protein [unclassified Streptomyces]|uniref:hypothetical protein n=1 Tax=unclassified Streptomyces TaxID=2593676 RepID=UPI0036E50749
MTAMVIALTVSALLILIVAATRLVHRFEARSGGGASTGDRPSRGVRAGRAEERGPVLP